MCVVAVTLRDNTDFKITKIFIIDAHKKTGLKPFVEFILDHQTSLKNDPVVCRLLATLSQFSLLS